MRQVSPKQAAKLRQLKVLVDDLKERAGGRSELSGKHPFYYQQLEPHHIVSRTGDDLLDPMNIILLTPAEHRRAQGDINQVGTPSKEELLAIVKPIRESQGFKKGWL